MKKLIALTFATIALFFISNVSQAATCEIKRPIKFAGLAWESNLVTVNIIKTILEEGYSCNVELEPGETLAMIAALYRGDIDVYMELWENSAPDLWHKGIKEGKIIPSEINTYLNASEGWWIPRYTSERYPDLKSVSDLKKYKGKFKDPEDPSKGRFLSCVPGWVCEVVNKNLFKAYGLEDDYNLVLPGSDAALQAEVVSYTKRKRDILTYYWTPTTLVDRADLVRLEMPAFNAKQHQCNLKADCPTPGATSFPETIIKKGLGKSFVDAAPNLANFIQKVSIDSKELSDVLNWLETSKKDPKDGAIYFLKKYPNILKKWVPNDIATAVLKKI